MSRGLSLLQLYLQKGWDVNQSIELHNVPNVRTARPLELALVAYEFDLALWMIDQGADLSRVRQSVLNSAVAEAVIHRHAGFLNLAFPSHQAALCLPKWSEKRANNLPR